MQIFMLSLSLYFTCILKLYLCMYLAIFSFFSFYFICFVIFFFGLVDEAPRTPHHAPRTPTPRFRNNRKHCALMIPMHRRKNKGHFVSKPFINWHKLQEKAKRHEQMKYHHDAMIATESFLNSVETHAEQNVNSRLDDKKGRDTIRKGASLNVFQKPSFSVVDSALPYVEITKS